MDFRFGTIDVNPYHHKKRAQMRNTPAYKISLGLTILLTLAAFFFLLTWVGTVINGTGTLPWIPLVLLALAAANCSFRSRLIVRRGLFSK